MPNPKIEVHPETAQSENIDEDDWVWVETPQIKGERVRFKVKITSNLDSKVVHSQHGWWFPVKSAPDHGCFESNTDVVIV